jgi:hypothetical protein
LNTRVSTTSANLISVVVTDLYQFRLQTSWKGQNRKLLAEEREENVLNARLRAPAREREDSSGRSRRIEMVKDDDNDDEGPD